MMDQIKNSKYLIYNNYSPKAQDITTVVPDNKNSPQLEGEYSTKIGGMWSLKYEIRSPKFYELLIKK